MTVILERTTEETGIGERILGPAGLVARNLPGYEARRPQMEMADLCEQMLRDGGQALIEAGTGTGKSLAYLIPAIESGERIVVSTESIQLQEQLVRKDLPFLERALGRPIRYAIAKGRRNYFCERNTITFIQDEEGRLAGLDPNGYAQESLRAAIALLSEFQAGWNGNKATVPIQVPDLAWSDFEGDDSCTGLRCPNAERCAYLKARAEFENADIIITNHHYYLLHHYVKQRTRVVSLLPEHKVWIADEAHTLSDIAQNVFGVELRQGQPKRFMTKLLRQLKALKLESSIDWDVPAVEAAADRFFGCFRGALKDEQLWEEFPDEILAEARARMGTLVDLLKPIQVTLHRAGERIDDDPETRRALLMLRASADGLIGALQDFFRPATILCRQCIGRGRNAQTFSACEKCDGKGTLEDPDPPVRYAEVTTRSRDRDGKKHVTLHQKPVETSRIFKSLYEELDTTIFTSATLATGGSFSPIAEELGLNAFDVETLQAKSPFDYERQVRGYYPTTVPDRKSPDYHDRLADEILRIVEWTEGRAFILFTANRDLRMVEERLRSRCPYQLLCQGDMGKDLLIEEFKREPSVLLGVKTFWTGVDIPGEALSCVVLVAFPFPQPEAPLVKARCQRIEARGQNSFAAYSLPRAIRDIQQGFGRLIRSRSDRGLFVVLDSRWNTTKYAAQIKRSLPKFPGGPELPTDWSLNHAVHATITEAEVGRHAERAPADRHGAGAGEAGPDHPALSGLLDELPAVVQEVHTRAGDLHLGVTGRESLRARAYDRTGGTGSLELAAGVDRPGVGPGVAPVSADAGADESSGGGPEPTEPAWAAEDLPVRWRYLTAFVRSIELAEGPGTGQFGVGSVRDGIANAEKADAREWWLVYRKQVQRVAECAAWLYEHQTAPDFAELSGKAQILAERAGATRREFAEWLGVEEPVFVEFEAYVAYRNLWNTDDQNEAAGAAPQPISNARDGGSCGKCVGYGSFEHCSCQEAA